jgi:hypothetical protein
MEVNAPKVAPEAAPAEVKPGINGNPPQIAALPAQAPKMLAKPPKIFPPSSAMLTSSSQRDTQTRLHSSGMLRGSQEKDEYLLRLLGKGSKPPLPVTAPSPSNGFRVPDPVPHRAAQASNRLTSAQELGTQTAALEKVSNPAGGQTATASGQPTSEVAPGWSYAETQRRIGKDAAGTLRATVIAHQVVFLEQLYDLHRAIAVQKLLVRNCPEVRHLMDEAARIVGSSASGQKDQLTAVGAVVAAATAAAGTVPANAPPAKRARLDTNYDGPSTKAAPLAAVAAALPRADAAPMAAPAEAAAAAALMADEPMVEDDGEPGLRPDSQFAAVPLPGETAATGDGSGDDGDGSGPNGSGGNGSGGGSNSPQPQLPPVQLLPPRRLLPLQGAPSEASQAPMMFQRASFMAPPWIQPMMPLHMQMQMQMPPGMDPLVGGGLIPPHYHQQYANLTQMQMAAPAAAAAAQMAGTTAGAPAAQAPPTGSTPPGAQAAPAPATAPAAAPAAPPVLVANAAAGASGQPSSRPPLPPTQAAAPAPGGIAPSPAAQVAAAGGDPMVWWAQHYYGRQQQQQQQQQQAMQMQMAAQMGPPQNAQHAQQMATAAAVAAFGNPATANYRWWHDPTATFGPPVDLNVVAAGIAAATRKAGTAAGEAESAPPSSAAAAAAATATAVPTTTTTNNKQKLVAPPPLSTRPRRSKRKPSDPIEEASSGTTGQDHHLGPHAVMDDAHFNSRSPHGSRGVAPPLTAATAAATAKILVGKAGAADTSAAKLLLSFSNKGHVA